MPRPRKSRVVCHSPTVVYVKPSGVPLVDLQEVVLGFDDIEALRLADLESCSQEEVGQRMGVSRGTVQRILASAHRRTTEALVHGKALRISDTPPAQPLTAHLKKRNRRPRDSGSAPGCRRQR